MTTETNREEGPKLSIWHLSELLEWSERGLLPVRQNQDIEYYCSFWGAYEVATNFQGVETLVHGPSGCLESFNSNRPFPGESKRLRPKCLSTNMKLKDVVYGSSRTLADAIVKVDREHNPSLIIVLTNCCADIIGENTGAVIKKASEAVKADVINLDTGGCSGSAFRAGADKVFESLFEYVADKRGSRNVRSEPTVNIFTKRISGRPAECSDVDELARLLGKAGIAVNTAVHLGTHYENLMQMPRAGANVSLCYLFGDGPMQQMEKLFGQPYVRSTFPVGLKWTVDWVKQVAKALGRDYDEFLNDRELEEYTRKIEKARMRYEGREAFIWMPGEKGLAMARFAAELGMRPLLFSTSYLAVQELQETIKYLIANGFDFPAVLTGKQEVLTASQNAAPSEKPILFMPRKFWTGELPTATINCFSDSVLGLRGIDYLLAAMDTAVANAGKKDYSLFNRYVETRFEAVKWHTGGPVVKKTHGSGH